MKKVIYTLLVLAAANSANAQGFLKRVKAKVTQAVTQPVANQVPAGMGSGTVTNDKWTDPSVCGTVVKTFSNKEINDHMGGFDIWFPYVRVVNNQLQLQVADYSTVLYDYTNGKLVQAGTPPNVDRNSLRNGNEYELRSIDFTQQDQTNAIMKKGPHLSSGMIPGKPLQTLTFKGKQVGPGYMMFQVAHNADSSVVAVAGASISGGLKYSLVSSTGQTLALPAKAGALPLVSPDGKVCAAWITQDNQAYISNGTVVKTINAFPEKVWLRNTGNIFSIMDGHGSTLYKNGEVYRAFDSQITPKQIFISKDDKNICWEGDHGLYFSDGTAFENGTSPHKVIIDGKEVIVFLTVNMTSGQIYLCKKEL